MPYTPLHLQNLAELKLRVGNVTDTVIATVLGLDYPNTEAFSVYVWNNTSLAVPDDNEVICPTSRLGMGGRWIKIDLLALHFETDPKWMADKASYMTEVQSDFRYLQSEIDPTVPEYIKEIQQIDIDGWNEKIGEERQLTINGVTYNLVADRTWTVGDLSSAGSYSNPTWLANLAATKITGLSAVATSNSYEDLSNKPNLSLYYLASNPNGYLTAVPAQAFASITGKPTTLLGYGITDGYPLTGNPSNFLTSVPAQSWNSITGKPVFATVATSASYNDLTNTPVIPAAQVNANWNAASGVSQVLNKPTALSAFTNDAVLTNTQITTALGFSPYNSTNPNGYITQAGARSSISLTTAGTTGNASYDSSTGVLNVPNYALSRSFNNAAVKTINGAGVRISTTRDAFVTYTITHTIALTLLLASGSSQVYLEISTDNVNWSTISQAGYSDGVAVAVALTKTTTNNIQGFVPANSYVRLRSIVSGGGSSAFTNGQEVLQ